MRDGNFIGDNNVADLTYNVLEVTMRDGNVEIKKAGFRQLIHRVLEVTMRDGNTI